MALNFSHRPLFPAHRSDENMVQGGSQDTDIRELLPADPFGMDISSTVTAITGWLEDLGASECGRGEIGVVSKGDFDYDYPLFAGLNFWLNTASMDFGAWNKKVYGDGGTVGGLRFACSNDLGNVGFDELRGGSMYNVGSGFGGCNVGGVRFACTLEDSKCSTTTRSSSCYCGDDLGNVGVGCVDGFDGLRGSMYNVGSDFGGCNGSFNDKVDDYVKNVVGVDINEEEDDNDGGDHGDDDDGAPHPALSFALAYLGVRDLLSVERVCKSLRVAVQTDTLLWRNINIDYSLNDRINDDVLVELTNRAQGHLQSLSLVECQKITDDGLKRVLDSNKGLIKLSVPGCTRLSIDGVVSCLRSYKPVAVTGIKYLRIGGLFGVTLEQFEELSSLLGIHHHQVPSNHHKPHFYHRGKLYLSYDDDRPIDIEICPRCQNVRLVYDCPVEGCQGKDHATQLCRACTLCIARCVQCGKCINDGEYEETFCLELLCSDCWKPVSPCQERQDVGSSSQSRHPVPQEPVISFHG